MREGINLQTRRELLQHLLPQYRGASTVKKKSKLLDAFTAATGYNRKYAMGLLNHARVEQSTLQRPRPHHYGPEVQHALFLVWHAANRICAKRLIPFLPTLLEALERHEHLQISEECRKQLLSMSAATADRLLSSQRKQSQRGLSTTRAGTLLKQQIPIRTFEEWKETRPGFLEADLVAHFFPPAPGSEAGSRAGHGRSFGRDRESFTAPVPAPLRIFPRCIRLYLLGSLFHHQVIHVVALGGSIAGVCSFRCFREHHLMAVRGLFLSR